MKKGNIEITYLMENISTAKPSQWNLGQISFEEGKP